MTRHYRPDQRVTIGDAAGREWTIRHLDGTWASLRDDNGAHCSVPVARLRPVDAPSPWPLRIGVSAITVFAGLSVALMYRVARGDVAIGPGAGTVLVGIATAGLIALMIGALRGRVR